MVLDSAGDTSLLLGSEDVPPVLENNAAGGSPFLLTCDHYGRSIPRILGDLGLPASELARHIAWDPGIAGVADALSKHLGAHLIAQRYSRLVIDCNRPPDALSSIPRISEATVIPGNEGLTRDAAELRRRAVFDPYHRRIGEVIDRRRAMVFRPCCCRCTVLRLFMPGSRGPGTSARCITAIQDCHRCCSSFCAASPTWWSATTNPLR